MLLFTSLISTLSLWVMKFSTLLSLLKPILGLDLVGLNLDQILTSAQDKIVDQD